MMCSIYSIRLGSCVAESVAPRDCGIILPCVLVRYSIIGGSLRSPLFGVRRGCPIFGSNNVLGLWIAVGLALWNERKHDRVVRWRVMGFRVLYVIATTYCSISRAMTNEKNL